MGDEVRHTAKVNVVLLTALTCAMFMMFAMTTDAVGEIIKIAKVDLGLSNTEASAFHWATMIAVAASGMFLGFLADRLGRKPAIILGLGCYGVASALFFAFESFEAYLALLFLSGLSIGVFKTAALALIGDIAVSTEDHTAKMNAVEGFFALGAIIGPLLVVRFHAEGLSWRYLYLCAAGLCAAMIIAALVTKYPPRKESAGAAPSLMQSFALMKQPVALGFSMAVALYVASEVAIFVWLPTFLEGYTGDAISMLFAANAVMIFFVLRAVGRFAGALVLDRLPWTLVVFVFATAIFACFLASALLGKAVAMYLLPLSGLFMSVLYPTLNSKGISCFPKQQHGAVAGLILFFTAAAAALGPLAMAFVSDHFGHGDMQTGFLVATGFAGLLCLMSFLNWRSDPTAPYLRAANESDYGRTSPP